MKWLIGKQVKAGSLSCYDILFCIMWIAATVLLQYILLCQFHEVVAQQFDLTRGDSVAGVVREVQELLTVSEEEVESMQRLLEEVYGEEGTKGRKAGLEEQHASLADSLTSLERVFTVEAALLNALQQVRAVIAGILFERRLLPSQVLLLKKEEEALRLAGSNKQLPARRDLEQLAEGLVDVLLVSEQPLQQWGGEGNLSSPHTFQSSDWEQLANAAATKGRLDLRIACLEQQLKGNCNKEEMERLKHKIQKEKDRHDAILIEFGRFGVGSNITRLDMTPYNRANKELVRKAHAQRTQFKFRRRQVFPLFKNFEADTSDPRSGLLDLYREEEITALCRGKKVALARSKGGRREEVCKMLDHGQPALRLAPFKLSILARAPFTARIQVLFAV